MTLSDKHLFAASSIVNFASFLAIFSKGICLYLGVRWFFVFLPFTLNYSQCCLLIILADFLSKKFLFNSNNAQFTYRDVIGYAALEVLFRPLGFLLFCFIVTRF